MTAITTSSFPTPDLALRSTDPAELHRVRVFGNEQAAIAEVMRTRLAASWSSPRSVRRAELAAVHSDLLQWRHELACRAPRRLGQGIPLDASRFLTTLRDGGPNYDRLGYVGRLKAGASWDPASQTYQGGTPTPAFRIMLAYGQSARDRFGRDGVRGDVLDNPVTLPDGRHLLGNRLVRGKAAKALGADLAARIARRGGDTSRIELGGDPLYAVSAADQARETMYAAALDLLADLDAGDLPGWQHARYLLYQAPIMKKGTDAVTRVFLVAVGAVILGRAPVLDHDVDLRCIVLGQAAATVLPSDPPPP